MQNIVLTRPVYHYQSYFDLHAIFKACRLQDTIIPKIDSESDNVYVYSPSNGEIHAIQNKKDRKCKLVWWQLERFRITDSWDETVEKHKTGKLDAVLVSDAGYYIELVKRGVKTAFCPIGYHPLFGEPNWNAKKIFDFVHLSYKDPYRRAKLFTQFRKQNFKIAPNGWGDKRKKSLHHSKFLVNTHQDDTNAIEPLRLILAVCHGLPIISESIDYPKPYQNGRLYGATYKNLPYKVGEFLSKYNKDSSPFIDKAKSNYDYFKNNIPFIDTLITAVNSLEL